MKRSGPLYTLLAGLALALTVLALNATTGSGTAAVGGGPGAPSPSPYAAAPGAPATPSTPGASSRPPSARPPSPGKEAEDYTGRTADGVADVAVSVRDRRATAYYCDGRTTESWLRGTAGDDGDLRLSGRGGATLTGTLRAGRVTGRVRVDGRDRDFTADRAEPPAGLYRTRTAVRGAPVEGGWIVRPDGGQVGLLTTGPEGRPRPAPELDPADGTVTVDGVEVVAERVAGAPGP
ncbi:hypothetical protein [Streptomyces sp. URMC 123]|uniref:hypothetical protein n=1 Tax=Streptomyces sp. URMC 123 TaxID=3423403 RepID=UPI003F1D757B